MKRLRNSSIHLRPALFLVLAILLALSAGCAYYNTFYNARRYFSEGEELGKDVDLRNQPTSSQKNKYQNCIYKCELVLEEYPDSDTSLRYLKNKPELEELWRKVESQKPEEETPEEKDSEE